MKNLNEILNNTTERIYYAGHSEQLHMIALTEFAKKIEKKGAVILSCCPKQIKLDNGTIKKVIGSYIKYMYKNKTIYYIQFDSNPFFGVHGYVTQENGASTGLKNISQVYDNVNEYSVSQDNVNQLITNIIAIEKHLAGMSPRHWDKQNKFDKQEIYKF